MKKLFIFLIIMGALSGLTGCTQAEAENPAGGDASADIVLSPTFTIINMKTGLKSGERVDKNFRFLYMRNQEMLQTWNPQNGDIFFFRGELVYNRTIYNYDIYGDYLAIIPLEDGFYWNGVCLYYNGFCYKITQTEEGLRIYNKGLWTLGGYCVLVQAGSSLALPELGINTEMLNKIHKIKVRRGHMKVAEMNPNIDGAFTPPGLFWKYYKNQGKEIRSASAGEYLKASDFIAKTDAVSGYFKSLTPELQIKKVSILSTLDFDCSKVY
jgi:hypothetical protein